MWCRAERLLEEYAEAKLALMNTQMSSLGRRSDSDEDEDSRYSSSSSPVCSRGRDPRKSSNVSAKTGQKYPDSSHAPVHHSARRNPTSRENSMSRENRTTRLAAKHSECPHDGRRSPLGVITQRDNLLVLGRSALPPLPPQHFQHSHGYLGS